VLTNPVDFIVVFSPLLWAGARRKTMHRENLISDFWWAGTELFAWRITQREYGKANEILQPR